MKVKKYTAPTMPEAMKKIRQELGSEAVILNSKVIYLGGFLGLFKKRNIQVIAALDNQTSFPKSSSVREEKLEKSIQPVVEQSKDKNDDVKNDVLEEIREMKQWMEKSGAVIQTAYPLQLQSFLYHLIDMDIKKEIAEQWVADLYALFPEENENLSKQEIIQLFGVYLENKLNEYDFTGIDYRKKFIHLVGPTGVGKTTTIAKLAADCILKDNKKVALITTDTYRIAAIDQLKTYSRILDIPLEVAYSLDDYQKAREKFKNYDIVLVDTAGRNFRNQQYVKELGELIDLERDVDTYLVLSLTSKYSDQEEIFRQFDSIPIKQFIFSKEDETSTYGSMINMMMVSGKGVAYITNGQEVPDNISELSVEKIKNLIVGGYADE